MLYINIGNTRKSNLLPIADGPGYIFNRTHRIDCQHSGNIVLVSILVWILKHSINIYLLIHFTLKDHNASSIWWFDCLDNYILSYKAPHESSWTLLSWIVINPVHGTSSNKKGWIRLNISVVEVMIKLQFGRQEKCPHALNPTLCNLCLRYKKSTYT